MARFIGRNWVCLILTSYLVLAVMGAFTFSKDITFCFDTLDGNLPGSGGFFTSINHTIDCLAENTIATGKANRAGSSRYFGDITCIPADINAGTYLTGSTLQAADDYHIPILKNAVQINLRIWHLSFVIRSSHLQTANGCKKDRSFIVGMLLNEIFSLQAIKLNLESTTKEAVFA